VASRTSPTDSCRESCRRTSCSWPTSEPAGLCRKASRAA
jgi:hypothetical protein